MSRLNYHHLYYFYRVATEGNLTRVAQQLHVSQSALSSQIRQLEERMQVQLFDRSARALHLTEAGQRVLGYARDIFGKGEELEALLNQGMQSREQRLRIGVLSTMSRNFIEAFIAPLLHSRNIRFSLYTRDFSGLLRGLSQHRFDLALSNSLSELEGLVDDEEPLWQTQLLARQALSVVGPPPLRPQTPFPEGYRDQSWVLPAHPSEIRRAFEGYCALWQFEPKVQMESDDMAMLRLLARDSGALAVLPDVVVRDEIKHGALVEYMTLPNQFESFYAITIKRQYTSAAVAELLARDVEEQLQTRR